MEPTLKYSWQQAVLDAFLEYDPDRLRERIAAAEIMISRRLIERPSDLDEETALHDALRALGTLMREMEIQTRVNRKTEDIA